MFCIIFNKEFTTSQASQTGYVGLITTLSIENAKPIKGKIFSNIQLDAEESDHKSRNKKLKMKFCKITLF